MKDYTEFDIEIKNKTKVSVRYYKMYLSSKMVGCNKCKDCKWSYRTDHFEFLNNYYISETGYKSYFIQPDYDDDFDCVQVSIDICNEIAVWDRNLSKQLGLL